MLTDRWRKERARAEEVSRRLAAEAECGEALANWQPWSLFGTVTWRKPQDHASASSALLQFFRDREIANGPKITWLAVEDFGDGGLRHFHFLVAGVDPFTAPEWSREANRRFGNSRIEAYDPERGAARYIAKKLAVDDRALYHSDTRVPEAVLCGNSRSAQAGQGQPVPQGVGNPTGQGQQGHDKSRQLEKTANDTAGQPGPGQQSGRSGQYNWPWSGRPTRNFILAPGVEDQPGNMPAQACKVAVDQAQTAATVFETRTEKDKIKEGKIPSDSESNERKRFTLYVSVKGGTRNGCLVYWTCPTWRRRDLQSKPGFSRMEAEWCGILAGLQSLPVNERVDLICSSPKVCLQFLGRYPVTGLRLLSLQTRVVLLIRERHLRVTALCVPRAQNIAWKKLRDCV